MPDYFREALHEVYIPRIQRGNAYFAANVLGARGALLSVLVHFFEHGRWGSLVETGCRGTKSHCGRSALHPHAVGIISNGHDEDWEHPDMRICYERAESLCHSLNRPLLLYVGIDRSVALFPHNRQADGNDADCQTSLLAGAGAE